MGIYGKREKENVETINAQNPRYNIWKDFDICNEVHINPKSTFIPEYGDVNRCTFLKNSLVKSKDFPVISK